MDTDKIVGGSQLLGEIRDLIPRKHYSIRTAQAYLDCAKRYILFHGKRHPKEMGEAQIFAFLNQLAVERSVAASTQNQALNALVFLYKQVLGREDLAVENITRAKRPERPPTVFDRGEIERLFLHIETRTERNQASDRKIRRPLVMCTLQIRRRGEEEIHGGGTNGGRIRLDTPTSGLNTRTTPTFHAATRGPYGILGNRASGEVKGDWSDLATTSEAMGNAL